MSTPVISIPASSAISEASELLRRFNINAAPVVENGRITGVATRQVLDKAVFHRLSQRPVTEYMTTEFETISPDAPVDEIRSKVSSIGARILPVVKGSTVIGVITRTDLLRLIQEEFKSGEAGPHEKKKDLSRAMEERLPKWVMERLKLAGATAERLGFKAYAVGGFARDILLRRENLDVDIVIEGGDGIVFAERLAKDQGLRVKSHQRFKTSVVLFPDGFKMDIATARLEYYEAPAVLPTVQPSSLKLDLYRRDFIMNTLAISLNPQTFGALTDFFGAERDIRDKVIRVIHNLSFVEDPTRAFRAVRFSEKFGFAISAHTLSLIKNSVKIDVFKRLGGARLLTELKNLLSEDAAKESIKRLSELRLLSVIHPSISPDQETLGLLERAKDSTAWHRLLYTEDKAEAWLTLLLALTHNLTEAQLKGLCRRLSMSGKKRLLAIEMRARGLDALRKIEAGGIARNSELWEALRPLPMETLLFLMAKTTDESARKAISSYVTRLRLTEPELKGRDLKRLGIPEGPVMGRVIAMLREKRLDNEITTRAEEEELARSAMKREDAG
jgi:tRNA nucleotidyltransferase (CCA-adding enzyme)